MSLPVHRLDDYSFQQIVDELRKRIPFYCEEWTDHNVSDPGITMVELFAWMTEMLLYRLNQVPELHYIKFMEMFGVRLQGPEAATVPVTFWFSSPLPKDDFIPQGTKISTTQTETQPPVIFTTREKFIVRKPELVTIVLGQSKQNRYQSTQSLLPNHSDSVPVPIFSSSPSPMPGDALYLGFANNISHHLLRLSFRVSDKAGTGLDRETKPPLCWEVATGNTDQPWQICEMDNDSEMYGFNDNGTVQLHLPKMALVKLAEQKQYWLRVRVIEAQRGHESTGAYGASPVLYKIINVDSVGCTIESWHAQMVENEQLGVSDGSPGQRFYVQMLPILARSDYEKHLTVKTIQGETQIWNEVEDFGGLLEKNEPRRIYTLNSVTGELRFAPTVRLRDGSIKQYGEIPERGSNLWLNRYHYGGGVSGRLRSAELNTLKTSIAYVRKVVNRVDSEGGLDAQSLDEAMIQMPRKLRTRQRAVTAEDFVFLVEQEFNEVVGRVWCIQTPATENAAQQLISGTVDIRIVPRPSQMKLRWSEEDLIPSQGLLDRIKAYLDKRRLLLTPLILGAPKYQWVVADVTILPLPGADAALIGETVLRRLYRFLNPLTGGFDGKGWALGQSLQKWQIYQYLRLTKLKGSMPGEDELVQAAADLQVVLYMAQADGKPIGDEVDMISVESDGVIASGLHHVMGLTQS